MKSQFSNLSNNVKQSLRALGGIIDENPHEKDFIRLWIDDKLMTISRNGNLWTLTYNGQTTVSPEDELPLNACFLLNYTVK